MTTLLNTRNRKVFFMGIVVISLCCILYFEVLNSDQKYFIILSGNGEIINSHRILQDVRGGRGAASYELDFSDKFIFYTIIVFFAIFICFVAIVCNIFEQKAAEKRLEITRTANRSWVRSMGKIHCRSLATARRHQVDFPSGMWKGYTSRDHHQLYIFDLHGTIINGEIQLSGSGNDHVGKYSINGVFNDLTGRMAFTKQYQKGTGNPYENLGHSVEYKGIIQNCIEAGIRGSWFESTIYYTDAGTFHIWPCNLRLGACYNRITENSPLLHTSLSPLNSIQSQDDSSLLLLNSKEIVNLTIDNECIICFDRSVNSVLHPCGHIAFCTNCANQLDSCPLCRSVVYSVEKLFFSIDPSYQNTHSHQNNNSHQNINSYRKIFNL